MSISIFAYLILTLVVVQRLGELVLSNIHTSHLVERGAKEYFSSHYKWIVLLHSTWLLAMVLSIRLDTKINIFLLVLFIGLQGMRYWIIRTLGVYWTTRIISCPEFPLIKEGPFRFVKHPNYSVVVLEIFILPLVFGFWQISIVFGLINLFITAYRIRREDEVLKQRLA